MKTSHNNDASVKTAKNCKGRRFIILLSNCLCVMLSQCSDFVEVEPPSTQLVSESVFADDLSATSAMVSIYSKMMESSNTVSTQMTTMLGMSSDEFVSIGSNMFYSNQLTSTTSGSLLLWRDLYQLIYVSNAIIEGLKNSDAITLTTKQQLQGEAKFVRAFSHFYLVNLYGDIPLVISTDYRVNAKIPRYSQDEVYQRIVADLLDAQALLDDSYSSSERIRPNKSAATAMLARVYLYQKNWTKASEHATMVINNGVTYSLVSDPNNVFQKNSSETILQMKPVMAGMNTHEGESYVLKAEPTVQALSDNLVNSFEPGDKRRNSWVGEFPGSRTWYFPYKYKIKAGAPTVTEYYMILRLAEQYLIRAEAFARENRISEAVTDINAIRFRAGLPSLSSTITQEECLEAIVQERRVELFCELGQRWLDLKRTEKADEILGPIKSPFWEPTDVWYPIPKSEIDKNSNLTQNLGY